MIPPNESTRLTDYKPVQIAADMAMEMRERRVKPDLTAQVFVQRDKDFPDAEVVELTGAEVSLILPCHVVLPVFNAQVKDLGRFCDIEIAALDHLDRLRHFLVTSRQNLVRVSSSGDSAVMPLRLVEKEWNMLQFDMRDVMKAAFGTEFVAVVNLAFHSSIRVGRCWFSDRPYPDNALPLFLRTLKIDPFNRSAQQIEEDSGVFRG